MNKEQEAIELLEKARKEDLEYTHEDSSCDCHCCRAIDKIDQAIELISKQAERIKELEAQVDEYLRMKE